MNFTCAFPLIYSRLVCYLVVFTAAIAAWELLSPVQYLYSCITSSQNSSQKNSEKVGNNNSSSTLSLLLNYIMFLVLTSNTKVNVLNRALASLIQTTKRTVPFHYVLLCSVLHSTKFTMTSNNYNSAIYHLKKIPKFANERYCNIFLNKNSSS